MVDFCYELPHICYLMILYVVFLLPQMMSIPVVHRLFLGFELFLHCTEASVGLSNTEVENK